MPIELSVLDNKTPAQSVVGVHPAGELPLRLGVLIDTSNSERKSSLYQPGVQGLSDLLNEVIKKPEDRAFIVSFSATPDVSPFMNRDELVKFKIDLTPGGGTAIHDAVYVACKERMQNDPTQPARRVLVVLSDGGDNLSHVTRDETIAAALESGTVIFTLSTSENPNEMRRETRRTQEVE